MKQKRKVKSLLPNKNDGNKGLFTSILLVLGVTLCLGSASLITTSVGAAGLPNNSVLPFTGLDDKSMNIYRLDFGNPENLEGIVSEMYLDTNSTLHVSPSNVIVTSDTSNNEVTDGVYGNILGGNNNKIKSNNVTLIAGEGIDVSAGNNDATVLLGKQKNPYGSTASNGAPLVVVGGDRLEVGSNHNGVVIIGGYENKIGDNVTNGVILGGESNKVTKNSGIAGGKKVELNVENVFAFSDGANGTFRPETNNAFYLNLDGGVGIGYNPMKKGVSVNGVIGLVEIDISNNCNSDNYGLMGSYNGCLVGCTKGTVDSRWELLDRGKKCEKMCRENPSKCYFSEEPSETPTPDYTSFCTAKTVNNAHMCNNVTNLYKNVVYESKLIDSDTVCPAEHDKCIFQCNSGSHMFYDNSGKPSCKLDCVLPWSESGEKIKHNEEVEISYNVFDLSCSNDAGTNPIPESCVNHKKSLTCKNGTLYIKGTNTKAVEGNNKYIYNACNLTNYKCDVSERAYNLTRSTIIDVITSWNDADRGETQGAHGVYKLCRDYNSNGYDVCTPTDKHYKLVRCQNGYSTGATHPYECKAKCSFDGKLYDHGQEILGYKSTSATCPSVCESTTLTCNDGSWVGDSTTYNRSSCSINIPSCPAVNDVESIVAMQHRDHSIYNDGCQVYSNNGNKHCVRGDLVYDLIGCAEGYHTESGDPINNKYCVPNTKNEACNREGAPKNAIYNNDIVQIQWQGSWNNGYWTTAADCTWYCGSNTHLEKGACVSNSKSVACNTDGVTKPSNASWITPVIVYWQGSWDNGYWQSVGDCGYTCDSGEYPTCEVEEEEEEEEVLCTSEEKVQFGYACCADSDCESSKNDGGAPARYCEGVTHTCRERGCSTSDPLETPCLRAGDEEGNAGICTNGECKSGCTGDEDCLGDRVCKDYECKNP